MNNYLCSGRWDEDQAWDFFLSADMPPRELCASAVCVGVSEPNGRVVLTRSHRGWEAMGGHIEAGESIETAMRREALEEGGFQVEAYELFGWRRVTAKRPVVAKQTGRPYPFPHSYIPWFVAVSRLPLLVPAGDEGEIFEARAFTAKELAALNLADQPLIDAALAHYVKASHRIRARLASAQTQPPYAGNKART